MLEIEQFAADFVVEPDFEIDPVGIAAVGIDFDQIAVEKKFVAESAVFVVDFHPVPEHKTKRKK
jgi:hypothetical protein